MSPDTESDTESDTEPTLISYTAPFFFQPEHTVALAVAIAVGGAVAVAVAAPDRKFGVGSL